MWPRVRLVSYADGPAYEATLQQYNSSWKAAGFHSAQIWRRLDLEADPLAAGLDVLERARTQPYEKNSKGRPVYALRTYCCAFKLVALLRAMASSETTHVLWMDASRHLQGNINLPLGLLHAFVHRLQKRMDSTTAASRPGANVYGLVHCSNNGPFRANGCFLPGEPGTTATGATMSGLQFSTYTNELRLNVTAADVQMQPHLASGFILLVNDFFNRQLVRQWLDLALRHPRAWCSGHTPEQASLVMLAFAHSLPLVNLCPWGPARKYWWKNFTTDMELLASGQFRIELPQRQLPGMYSVPTFRRYNPVPRVNTSTHACLDDGCSRQRC